MPELFLLGNKRSGTSHLVHLLNLHPRLFVTHESDVAWLLYQLAHGEDPKPYEWDAPAGLKATSTACSEIIASHGSLPASTLYELIQRHLMKDGSGVQVPRPDKDRVEWLGDKKPVQHADPRVHTFLRAEFPTAKYLHLIRHPRAVVASMVAAKDWGMVPYWREGVAAVLNRWAIHEEWVLAAKQRGRVLTVRFEDLIAKPQAQMRRIFAFLGLKPSAEVMAQISGVTQGGCNDKYSTFKLPFDERVARILEHYGYAQTGR